MSGEKGMLVLWVVGSLGGKMGVGWGGGLGWVSV